MDTAPAHPRKVLVMAASTRTGSVNQALARHVAARLDIGRPVMVSSLRGRLAQAADPSAIAWLTNRVSSTSSMPPSSPSGPTDASPTESVRVTIQRHESIPRTPAAPTARRFPFHHPSCSAPP